jgi:predicted RNase H-like nuclease (RuvC/YqgF family)
MAKSSSEIIAEQLAERWRQRAVERDAQILRLQEQVIESARTVEYLLQRLQEAEAKLDETGEVP